MENVLDEFSAKYLRENGRALRVLHIGNIANNAYQLAFLQNKHGIDAFVVSPEYTHVMGYPAWEEREIILPSSMHFNPDALGPNPDIHDWFASGDWKNIHKKKAKWSERWDSNIHDQLTTHKQGLISRGLNAALNSLLRKFRNKAKQILPPSVQVWLANSIIFYIRSSKAEDKEVQRIMQGFDLIQCYGPYASVIPRIRRVLPTVALEHGTLREWVFAPYPRNRQAKKGYQMADGILITNQDCLQSLPKLEISPMSIVKSPHPMQDDKMESLRRIHRDIVSSKDEPFRILIPARHAVPSKVDMGKGTSVILQAIEQIARELPDVQFTLVNWGDGVGHSKDFIRANGLEQRVQWSDLLSHPLLRKQMAMHHLVIDQLKIEAYGGITADALGIGCVVATAHSCTNDKAFFGECAPIEPVKNSTQIFKLVEQISQRRDLLIEKCSINADWYDSNLSSGIVLERITECYSKILSERIGE